VLARALRAIILDGRMYRQIGDEPQEMFYALIIVIFAAAAFGLGLQHSTFASFEGAPPSMIAAMVASTKVTSWVIWAGVVYFIGSRFMGGKAGFRKVLRNLGFTFGPGVLAIFAEIPTVGPFLLAISILWLYPAGLIAIKETQEFGWVKAFFVNSLGWWLAFFLIPALLIPISAPPPTLT
jgi:hypothetical protein